MNIFEDKNKILFGSLIIALVGFVVFIKPKLTDFVLNYPDPLLKASIIFGVSIGINLIVIWITVREHPVSKQVEKLLVSLLLFSIFSVITVYTPTYEAILELFSIPTNVAFFVGAIIIPVVSVVLLYLYTGNKFHKTINGGLS